MSDERTFKPVAVAVAAATLMGGLAGVPANAADNTDTDTNTGETDQDTTNVEDAVGSFTDAYETAETEMDRNLTYEDEDTADELRDLLDDNADAYGNPDDVDADTLTDTADRIAELLANLGDSVEETAYQAALDEAQGVDTSLYKEDSTTALTDALEQVDGFDADTADADALTGMTMLLSDAVENLEAASWSVDGVALTEQSDGSWTGTLTSMPDELAATGSDGTIVTLTKGDTTFTQGDTSLGVGENVTILTGSTGDADIMVTVRETAGSETTASMSDESIVFNSFTLSDDGVWTATATGTLGSNRADDGSVADVTAWAGGDVPLSDGTTLTDPTLGEVSETSADGATTWTRDITYTGTDANGTSVRAVVTASYTYDPTIDVTLQRTSADGTSEDIGVFSNQDATTLENVTLDELPYANIGDDYQLIVGQITSTNVRDIHLAQGLDGDGGRVFTLTLTADSLSGTSLTPVTNIIRISQPFASAPTVTGNEDAALEGFRINGEWLADYSEDVVDYTITAAQGESVTVEPVAKDGQTVVAGDITLTAFTTVQTWTVTGPQGGTRTYTVTLVREHTEQTAVEAFTPDDPIGLVSDQANPSEDNTVLESVGYMLDGEYYPQESLEFEIPEGGVFAWTSYEGQVVTPTVTRLYGMTYRYDLGVLSTDREHYDTTSVTVTYITEDTHKAELTGINVDNEPIDGFSPEVLEYTVQVGNPGRWTIVPQFDRMTGMSVTVHKEDADATLTAVSGDQLVSTVYEVHATGSGVSDTVSDTLAQTGITTPAWLAGFMTLILGVLLTLRNRFRHRSGDGSGVTV